MAQLASTDAGVSKRIATRMPDAHASDELPELRASVGYQPRARNHRPLVPEVKHTASFQLSGAEMKAVEDVTEGGELKLTSR